MAKKVHVDVIEAPLDLIASSNQMVLTPSEPADRAAALSAALASETMSGGDFSIGAGSPDGRTLTVSQKPDVPIDTSGDATHVCLVDGTRLLAVTTCPSQTLTEGGTVTIASWGIRSPEAT